MPAIISRALTGVAMSASMVPRSHSRATTMAVSRAPIRVMMTAIRPGTRKFLLLTSGLNQILSSMTTGTVKVFP